jgi:hypothetical protein
MTIKEEHDMKLWLGAAFAALLMATPASAQTEAGSAACAAIAPPPALPDGATATGEQMQAANEAYNAWFEGNRTALECMRPHAEAAQALVNAFNQGINQANSTQTSWQAEVAEFNARAPQPQRQRSRDEFDRSGR